MTLPSVVDKNDATANFKIRPSIKVSTNAIIKFITGPARDTNASPFLLYFGLKLLESICTGLPQPIPQNINIIIPIGSKCFNGSILSLPCLSGVSSPNLTAIHACANSCNEIAIITPGIVNNKDNNPAVPILTTLKITIIAIIKYTALLSKLNIKYPPN